MDNNQEPIILGTVKKGKTGKPILAIVIIVLIGTLIYFLPTIQNYFGDRSIIDLITSGELISFIKNKNNDSVNNNSNDNLTQDEFVRIGDNKILENVNLILANIQIKDNVLSYNIKSRTATYDAKLDDLYLQIFVDKNTLVYTKSLDEVFTITGKEVKENVNFYTGNNEYYAVLKTISSDDIEEITLTSDESGLASIICSLENDKYEYIFKNKELIEMKRTFQYKYNEEKLEDYQNAYKTYSDLKMAREKFNIEVNMSEDYIGFNYSEVIKLENVDVTQLGTNYYSYKTLAKVIKFKQEAKGFDCE